MIPTTFPIWLKIKNKPFNIYKNRSMSFTAISSTRKITQSLNLLNLKAKDKDQDLFKDWMPVKKIKSLIFFMIIISNFKMGSLPMIRYLILIHYCLLPSLRHLNLILTKKIILFKIMSIFLRQNKLIKNFKSFIIKCSISIGRDIKIWVQKRSISILKIYGSKR
jgi:hypothetical protein